MQCPSCRFENAAEANFCAQCGARLERLCPSCGAAIGAEHRFCQSCGAALTSEAEAETGPPAALEPGPERRQVTVLFADLSGFTRLTSELDAEEAHALLNRYFEAVDRVVESYGGRIDKHIGDAVMAVFGAPVAHTNDPERAVRAALDIHGAVAALEPPLSVHIGIASGQVVASGTGSEQHREYTVTGESVNLAARLTDMAKAGETLIAGTVRAALAEHLEATALGETPVEGLSSPVPVWRLAGFRAETPASEHPFVGRRRELRQVQGALEDCREERTGQVVFVRGEAGIGKTRLARIRHEGF